MESALNFDALQPGQQAVMAVVVEIKEGFHAQSHTPSAENYSKFETSPEASPAIHWLVPIYPPGEVVSAPGVGELNVYTGRVTVYVPFEVVGDAPSGDLKLTGKVNLQVCNDKSCFPPQDLDVSLDTKIVARGQAVRPTKPELFKDFDPATFQRSTTRPATTQPAAGSSAGSSGGGGSFRIFGHDLRNDAYGLIFASAFLVGIILNAVPCVLPVLPLKAIGFYEVSQHNRAKSIAFGAVLQCGIDQQLWRARIACGGPAPFRVGGTV